MSTREPDRWRVIVARIALIVLAGLFLMIVDRAEGITQSWLGSYSWPMILHNLFFALFMAVLVWSSNIVYFLRRNL